MIVDGRLIAHEIKATLQMRMQKRTRPVVLGILIAHETLAIRKFVELKEAFGKSIGVEVKTVKLSQLEQKTENFLRLMLHATRDVDGLVLQLPLPAHVELVPLLKLFPLSHDVDVLGETAFQQFKERALPFLPPVVAALAEIIHRHAYSLAGRKVLVIGQGHLVGEPAAIWAKQLGAQVTSVTAATLNVPELAREADVIITGAGVPGLVTPDMIKDGVMLLDAGTSESGGVLRGDVAPECAAKATLFTPTPGGIGPITVAKVFENLLTLTELKDTTSPTDFI